MGGKGLEVPGMEEPAHLDPVGHPVELRHPSAGGLRGLGRVMGVDPGAGGQPGQACGVVALGASDIEDDLRIRRQGLGQVGMQFVLVGPDQAGCQGPLRGVLHIGHTREGAAQHPAAILFAQGPGDHPRTPDGQDPQAQGRPLRRGQAPRCVKPRAEPLPDRLQIAGHFHPADSTALWPPAAKGSSRPSQAAPRVTAWSRA